LISKRGLPEQLVVPEVDTWNISKCLLVEINSINY